jgi:serine/threonine protein kinase/tetratricopeptide (TPR) repeat protein
MDDTAPRSLSPVSPSQSSSCASRVFADDEWVSSRYRIRSLLGCGGMGEVYEAEDLELGERVALKVLRRELAERPGALEQLKREVALARKVSHPNVCRLFDVGFHLRETAQGAERICFLTMELLQGESLSALLRRHGPLSHNEALPLARQLAEGLSAAHEAGILHRDLKSANVLLIRSPVDGSLRPVITDFGLACAAGEASAEPGEPGSRWVGTPAYMAPEQLEGQPLTPASDLYALGILLFELLTGARPFQGADAWSTATQRLHTRAPSPRTVRPELAPRWEALILRCLERQPSRRFQSAQSLLAALPAPLPSTPRLRPVRSQARMLLTVLAVGLLPRAHSPLPATSEVSHRNLPALRSLALLGFADRSAQPDTAWLSDLLSQAIAYSLRATTDELSLFPTSIIDTAKTAVSLSDAGVLPPETREQLRDLLACDFLVQGTYSVTMSPSAPTLRLELRILDAATGGSLASLEESGPLEDVLRLSARVGERAVQALGIQGGPALPLLQQLLPSGLDALRLFSESQEKMRQGDGAAAQERLEQALAMEPEVAGLHSALASALIHQGARSRGREELRTGLSLAEQAPARFRLAAEAAYHGYAPDWRRAAELHQQLFELTGHNPYVGIGVANALLSAREPQAALAMVAKVRETAPPIFSALLDATEAKAALNASDLPRAQAAAARAVASADALKDEYSAASHRLLEADALKAQGLEDRALQALRDAVRRFQRSGNRLGEASATRKMADMLPQRDLRGRLQAERAALALYQEARNRAGLCMTLLAVAGYEHELGELRGALRSAEVSLPLCRDMRMPVLETHSLTLMGQAYRSLGKLDDAEAAFRDQLQLARKHEMKSQIAISLAALGDVSLARGDLSQARQRYIEAARLTLGPQNKPLEQELALDLRLARLAQEEGRLAEALRLADKAATSVSELDVPEVHELRARALLAQGRYSEANAALLQAGASPVLRTQLRLRIQRALLSARRGGPSDRPAALKSLQEVLAESQRIEWAAGQYEASLALAEATGQEVEQSPGWHTRPAVEADGARVLVSQRPSQGEPLAEPPEGALVSPN